MSTRFGLFDGLELPAAGAALVPVTLGTAAMRWLAMGLVTFAVVLAAWSQAADETSLPYRSYVRYTSLIERKLRGMFVFVPGRRIALAQAAAMFVYTAAAVSFPFPFWYAGLVLIALGPLAYVESQRRERLALLEDQLDGFILALANALKTTPSIGAAFNSVVAVIDDPMKQEVDLALKEMKVGSSLDQALLHMAARVGSRQLDSALSAILIGRQVGGNLPKILESTSSTLREMKRLEGVVKTKTADGRMQMWVIAAMPLVFIVALNSIWPGYFTPLTTTMTGYAIIAIVCVCWVSSLILARKVLAVDL